MTRLLLFTFLSIPLIGAYILFSIGIVVIYRASRVLNLAHGAMAMVPAYFYYSLTKHGTPRVVAIGLAILGGAALGVAVEALFVRRLRRQGPTAQTVGTVAVTGLLIALVAKVYGTSPIQPPAVFPKGQVTIAGASVAYGSIALLLIGLLAAAGLLAFFRFTQFGLALRGAAQNRTAASIVGINPDMAASAAWAVGGATAALAGVLLAAVTNLNPYTLSLEVLPGFVAALIGGLESLVGAIIGAVIAGLAFGIVPLISQLPVIGSPLRLAGAPQLVLTLLALGVMISRGRRLSGADADTSALGAATAAFTRRSPVRPTTLALLALLLIWPWIVPFSVLGSSLLALEYAVVALSLVVLSGWVGQISLAQATFVGIGALVTGLIARDVGVGFPFDVVIGVVAAAAAATILGAVALRIRGLYLAVATLIFAWMGDAFLFPSPWLGASGGSSTIPNQRIGHPGGLVSIDLTSRRVVFLIFLAVIALVVLGLSNLRDTRVGRAFFAIRGSEVAAASLGVHVTRYKLYAFAVAGALAGLGGGMLIVDQRTVVPASFFFTVSLQYLAIAVVGGMSSLGGGVAAGVLFAGLNELFYRVSALAGWLDLVSASLLAVVLLLYPGGLAAAFASAKRIGDRFSALVLPLLPKRAARPSGSTERSEQTAQAPAGDWLDALARPATRTITAEVPDQPTPRTAPVIDPTAPPALYAAGVTVKFGGLTAVSNADLDVQTGEIVGLIGPNGAGKTTLFNAVLGLNEPAAGAIKLFGQDITGTPAHRRAGMGVARTFQVLQLFSGLSVFDNVLMGTHLHHHGSLMGGLVGTPVTIESERRCRQRVAAVLDLLGLSEVADSSVTDLPFGTLRLVELGRALATGGKLLMLDEAASGLNDIETARLVEVVQSIRALGVSVLLIEHDMQMVSAACDRVFVMDRGEVIASGTPDEVSRDERVREAYLGVTAPKPAARKPRARRTAKKATDLAGAR
ncbi:MAG: branched-chain amino acid transport system ATP-binding protein livM [Frankiaceae bacterium]|nr:branched-chain amino acid transport system ATP-binding protein livM [Frankiaceae bacterium]